ncbi:unnamed protein product [[Candida] boidinii]|nr:unnamed protein product [[Candida] boidinii]
MFALVARSTRAVSQRNVRFFSAAPARLNLISDLYIKELKAFKPTPVSAAEAESATKPWKLPVAAKVPALEAEGADALAEYDSAAVEVAAEEGAAVTEEYKPDDWFVFEEIVEPGAAHHH